MSIGKNIKQLRSEKQAVLRQDTAVIVWFLSTQPYCHW